MDSTLQLLIADDHPILLKGLADSLKSIGYEQVITAINGAQALDMIIEQVPTIAILDIEMPMLDGFEVIAKAKDLGSTTKFIILTSYKEKAFVLQAQKFNIQGYLLKDEGIDVIDNCIKEVAKGNQCFSPSFNEVIDIEITPQLEKIKFLSPSERTIVRYIAQEKTSKEIAVILSISHRTVQKHRTNIIQKLNLTPGADSLTLWAQEHREFIDMM
ncbi:MAG: response regulator transcription factor [Nonlabens sp.]|uniref:response regulator transcription factor n=1 Tax=Nonlabens sp. TaxID=1888209 RepID=UPI003EF6472C